MGPIRVYKRARPADAPKPLLDPEQRHAHEVATHAVAPTTDEPAPPIAKPTETE
jgi:hypothetical protein